MGTDFFGNCDLGSNSQHCKRYFNNVLSGTENLYLCGNKLSDYLDPETRLLTKPRDYHSCHPILESTETSVLFMIALKRISSTKFVQGDVDGVPRSWIEFTFDNEKFVADLIWGYPFIMTKEFYYSTLAVVPRWVCSYEDFWDLPLTKSIYSRMQKKETSEGIFEYFSEYHRNEGYGFSEVYSEIKETEVFFPFS